MVLVLVVISKDLRCGETNECFPARIAELLDDALVQISSGNLTDNHGFLSHTWFVCVSVSEDTWVGVTVYLQYSTCVLILSECHVISQTIPHGSPRKRKGLTRCFIMTCI
jgi:hypothetical protein